jgi:phosphomannomutase
VRPSGTEPKIKFYYYAVPPQREESAARVEMMQSTVEQTIQEVK